MYKKAVLTQCSVIFKSSEVLSIGNSSHAGSIPSEIANLSLLRYFDASNCDLSGTLPRELSNLQLLSKHKNDVEFISCISFSFIYYHILT